YVVSPPSHFLSSTPLDPPLFFSFFFYCSPPPRSLHSFPTRRSSDLSVSAWDGLLVFCPCFDYPSNTFTITIKACQLLFRAIHSRSEEHTSELQSRRDLVCRLLLEKKKKKYINK